jgi:hypothetical protein
VSTRLTPEAAHLEDTPGDATQRFSGGKELRRGGEEWDEDGEEHPHHEKHEGLSASKVILAETVDDQPKHLSALGGVGESGLPRRCFNSAEFGNFRRAYRLSTYPRSSDSRWRP